MPDVYNDMYERYKPLLHTCQFGIECNVGWAALLERLFKRLSMLPPIHITQIKEKFGELRVYYNLPSEEELPDPVEREGLAAAADAIIKLGEDESHQICERCGKPGKERYTSWIMVLCDECAAKVKQT